MKRIGSGHIFPSELVNAVYYFDVSHADKPASYRIFWYDEALHG